VARWRSVTPAASAACFRVGALGAKTDGTVIFGPVPTIRTNDNPSLFKAVMLRHDCVHRHGFDKNGNELKVFTKAFVQDTADLIKVFVENINKPVRTRSAGASCT
jgi:hypothetical protein